MIDTRELSNALTERFRLDLEATTEKESSGQKIIIHPIGIERTISFRVEFILGWRSVSATFIPGNYAASLVAGIKSATPTQLAIFTIFSDSLKSKGAEISLKLDSTRVDSSAPTSWPKDWAMLQLSMKKVGVVVEKTTGYNMAAFFPWATGFIGLALALLPLVEEDELLINGKSEGSAYYRLSKQYERNRINRAACIEIHGMSCKLCGFNFGERFGELGYGFIHIHHVVPLSEMGGSYVLNPLTDLIPVCPNCHAMIHRRRPALGIEEVKNKIVR
jgi:5-methylcytosine-specific restriction protein A